MSEIPEKILQSDKVRHYEEYKFLNSIQKLKKRLREDTGARPQPLLDPSMKWPNLPAEVSGLPGVFGNRLWQVQELPSHGNHYSKNRSNYLLLRSFKEVQELAATGHTSNISLKYSK